MRANLQIEPHTDTASKRGTLRSETPDEMAGQCGLFHPQISDLGRHFKLGNGQEEPLELHCEGCEGRRVVVEFKPFNVCGVRYLG